MRENGVSFATREPRNPKASAAHTALNISNDYFGDFSYIFLSLHSAFYLILLVTEQKLCKDLQFQIKWRHDDDEKKSPVPVRDYDTATAKRIKK